MKLAILDRDGVINYDSDQYIKSPAEWRPIAGSIEAIARLNQNGYRIAVATNQSGIGRGLFDMATLNAINDKMMEMVFRQGGASTRCSSARTPRPRNATAASRAPACWRRSPRASTRT
jgi:histidinol-phosphate phosphatase family protein